MTLMTIGYEGFTLDGFLGILLENGVRTLVDIRENPISRKPGFSKTALSMACERNGLRYIHLVSLGCPKEIRRAYREDGNWQLYTNRFLRYLATQKSSLMELAEIAVRDNYCLMCFETDFFHCHRSFVADWVAYYSGQPGAIKHLGKAATERTAGPVLRGDRLDQQSTTLWGIGELFP